MKRIMFILFCLPLFSEAQPPIQWEHCYGGSNTENSLRIIQTTDGGYIMVGQSNSTNGDVTGNHGNLDMWVVKINGAGAIQWEKSYGGTGDECALNVIQLADGGYVIDAYKYSTDGDVTCTGFYWLIKIDDTGALIWQKCLNVSRGLQSESPTLIQTPDNGFALATSGTNSQWPGGHGAEDIVLIKFDSNGDTLWHKCYGGSNNDNAWSISNTADRGFIIAGYTRSSDGQVSGLHYTSSAGLYDDYWVVKTDSMGNFIWGKCFGGLNEDVATSISQTNDGGYIVAGYSKSNDGDVVGIHGADDYWVVKLSDSGGIQWSKCLGGTANDFAFCVKQTTDSGYIVCGWSASADMDVVGNHGNSDTWIVKLTNSGSIQWTKCLGGTLYETAMSAQQTADKGYIIFGYASSNDGDVSGNHSTGGNYDYWVVKLYPDNVTKVDMQKGFEGQVTVYPNPAFTELNISAPSNIASISIYNPMGQVVYGGVYNSELVQIDVSNLPTGIYFVKVNGTEVRKFVKQ